MWERNFQERRTGNAKVAKNYVAKSKYVNKKESLCGWKMRNETRKMKSKRED